MGEKNQPVLFTIMMVCIFIVKENEQKSEKLIRDQMMIKNFGQLEIKSEYWHDMIYPCL